MDFEKLFSGFKQLKVAVIGDIMLDTYWWGKVDRISPEAPVPVVAVTKKEQRIGGGANVAFNVHSLGANVSVLSIVGKDDDGEQLTKLLETSGISTKYIVQSAERITTNKIRIISRNQHMLRLDAEMAEDISTTDEDKLLYAVEQFVAAENPDVMIFEDYNKGILTPLIIDKVISLCKKHDIIITVDPKRKNFLAYKGVDIFKPNFKEVKEGLNLPADDINLNVLKDIHVLLQERLNHKVSFITLSEKGVFYQHDKQAALLPTHIRDIADVSGAGDTVIAVASLVYAVSKDAALMAQVSNIAGGMVCEEVGTVAIDAEKLKAECKLLLG